jgi:hypothetical protein
MTKSRITKQMQGGFFVSLFEISLFAIFKRICGITANPLYSRQSRDTWSWRIHSSGRGNL